jgi:hypothetical protein
VKYLYLAGVLLVGSMGISRAQNVGERPLDAATVGIPGSGTIVAAVGTVFRGCWIENDPSSTNNLVVDGPNTANVTTPSSTAAILAPGQTYYCPGGSVYSITVDAADTGHKIYGRKW